MIAAITSRAVSSHGIRISCALALLVAVATPPTRTLRSAAERAVSAACLVRGSITTSSRTPTNSGRLTATPDSGIAVRLKALPSQNEEEDLNETARHTCAALDSPSALSATAAWETPLPGGMRAVHPLRC